MHTPAFIGLMWPQVCEQCGRHVDKVWVMQLPLYYVIVLPHDRPGVIAVADCRDLCARVHYRDRSG